MSNVDLLVAWDWEFDAEFIKRFEELGKKQELKCIFVNPSNLAEVLAKIDKEKINVKVLLDRASDTNAMFDPLIDKLILSGVKTLNEASHAIRAMDKATMHLEFLSNNIDVPYTIILSPSDNVDKIKEKDLKHLGRPFIIKPSKGGGGIGVVVGAETLGDIMAARRNFADDKYLLQEKVVSIFLDKHRAYFRVFHICGKNIPCWWDDQTHIFTILSKEEEDKYKLGRLRDIAGTIARICRLDFFSTEICVTDKNNYVVVDYVNDPCDMRPKSIYVDGVPDEVITQIINEIVFFIKKTKREPITAAKKDILLRRRDFEVAMLSVLKRHR